MAGSYLTWNCKGAVIIVVIRVIVTFQALALCQSEPSKRQFSYLFTEIIWPFQTRSIANFHHENFPLIGCHSLLRNETLIIVFSSKRASYVFLFPSFLLIFLFTLFSYMYSVVYGRWVPATVVQPTRQFPQLWKKIGSSQALCWSWMAISHSFCWS